MALVMVTGAGGILGSHLAGALRAAGHIVIACDRQPAPGIDAVWDLTQADAPEPDSKPEVVVHAAALVGRFGHPMDEAEDFFAVNVEGTRRVAAWSAARQVRQLVYISGAVVYGGWHSAPKRESDAVHASLAGAYAYTKWSGEVTAARFRNAGGALAVLRLSSLYGPGYERGLIARLLRQGHDNGAVKLLPPLDDGFDLLHVADAAHTITRVVEARRDGLWNIGGGEAVTLYDLGAACAGTVGSALDAPGEPPTGPGRVLNWVDDAAARRELGHTNTVPLQAGLAGVAAALGFAD